jgi:hypothetical protein
VSALLAVLVLALLSFADVPRTISYQGLLTDTGGNPIPDGAHDLIIRLSTVDTGGSAVYTEAHSAVSVANGGFNVLIGSITPPAIAFDQPLWLSLQVDADPELSPRVPFASSPYSLGLSLPFDGHADGATPTFAVRNATRTALLVEGSIDILAPGGGASPIIDAQKFGTFGGQLQVKDEANPPVVRLEPDRNGTGGFLTVYRSELNIGFSVNGNDVTEEPIMSLTGSARTAVFDMSNSGDTSVQLPSSSISALEGVDEPGVAEIYSNSVIQIGTGITTIASRSIIVWARFVPVVRSGDRCTSAGASSEQRRARPSRIQVRRTRDGTQHAGWNPHAKSPSGLEAGDDGQRRNTKRATAVRSAASRRTK